MQAMIALIRREYLEHRGAFVVGPAILLGLMLLAAGYATWSSHMRTEIGTDLPTALRFYEAIVVLSVGGWWMYLLIMLFFYFSDAFSADSRNNSMLFWKSMPQSDLKVLSSKFFAALTIFPTAILLALAITGVIAYLPALTAGNILPGYAPPGFFETVSAFGNVFSIAVVFFALGLLWYAPFFAWVGLLSTVFKRWSLPLAFLIPVVVGLFESLIVRGQARPGGYILNFLRDRLDYSFAGLEFETIWILGEPWNGTDIIGRMLTGLDWTTLVGGLAVAVIFVYAASEYRRRFVLT